MSATTRPSKIVQRPGTEAPTKHATMKRNGTAAGSRHMGLIAAMPCVLCELLGEPQTSKTDVHHIREGAEPGALDNGYFRSRDWMAAVASIGTCVLCGAHGVQVAHRNEGKAKGRKMDDSLTAAICPTCHTEIDQGKTMTREERRATMDKAIVLTLQALTRGGFVGVVA